jgi:hypothetical protein
MGLFHQICQTARTRKKPKLIKTNYWRNKMSKGWSEERRLQQAAAIKQWQPWKSATGPKTKAGKKHSSRNAYKGGGWLEQRKLFQQLRQLLRDQKKTIDSISD